MALKLPIYMDYHATTPVDPRVLEAMMPFFSEKFGNAASVTHVFGWEAQEAVEKARTQIAAAIGAEPKEIIFTSGATEADNLALKGTMHANARRGNHLIVSTIEHNAVLDSARRLEKEGIEVTYVPVRNDGLVDPDAIRRALTDRTVLISVMTANNEIGTIQPIRAIGQIARERGIYFHTDASQAIGRISIDVNDDQIDLLSLSGHKVYGPKGIGALYVRRHKPRVKLAALLDGGGHEQRLRSGTLPVPLIVGLARAIMLAREMMEEESSQQAALRDRLMHAILGNLDGVRVNGTMNPRLPNNLDIAFEKIDGEAMLTAIKDVALSSGSACSSAEVEPSHVLTAIGLPAELASGSIRFGLGRWTTEEEVDYVAGRVVEVVGNLRRLAPGRPGVAPANALN
jgi:cysteine desulfurase